MAITVSVSIDKEAVDEILRKCELFYPWFSGKFLRKSGERIAELMREKAPVRTGRLRQSITVRLEAEKATVGPTAPYAPYVEYARALMEQLAACRELLRLGFNFACYLLYSF